MSFQITFPPKQFKELNAFLDNVQHAAVQSGGLVTRLIGQRFRDAVSRQYAYGAGAPLSRGASQKREQGKRTGRTPRLRKYPGLRPLFRSGRLSRLIAVTHRIGQNGSTSTVFVRAARTSGGGKSDIVAAINEFGGTWFVPIPPWARTYLRALMLGVAGTSTPVRVQGDFWLISMVKIPARPIWMPLFQQLLMTQPAGFAHLFGKDFNRRLSNLRVNGQPLTVTFR